MSEEIAPELLPCPFCGAQAKSWLTSSQGAVYCDNLECFGPRVTATYRSDAVVQWNKRTPLSREAALVEALEPFIRAAQIIEKRPNDYKDRIAMVGGLGEPADLHKRHFSALLAALPFR